MPDTADSTTLVRRAHRAWGERTLPHWDVDDLSPVTIRSAEQQEADAERIVDRYVTRSAARARGAGKVLAALILGPATLLLLLVVIGLFAW